MKSKTSTSGAEGSAAELGELELAALRLVHRHSGGFGRQRLAQVLAGRRTAGVREHELDREPEFGAAGDLEEALAVLDGLAGRRFVHVLGRERRRPVLALTGLAEALRRVTAGNPRQPPPARLGHAYLARVRHLTRWRDLIAMQEERPARTIASVRTLRQLVKLDPAPATLDQLAASGLLGEGAPPRFRRVVLDVLQMQLADPTVAEVVQTLASVSGDPGKIVITPEVVEWGRTQRGGFTRAQLVELGVGWPPPRGWRREVVGKVVTAAELRRYLESGGGPEPAG